MKRKSVFGLCLIAIFLMSAFSVASSAMASPPDIGRCLKKATAGGAGFAPTVSGGTTSNCTKPVSTNAKFEWTPTCVKCTVTSKMTSEKATLEGEGGIKISCTAQKTPAFTVKPPKEVSGVVGEYSNCSSTEVPCENEGKPNGIINTGVLEGEIGLVKLGENPETHVKEPLKNVIANVLFGPGGKPTGTTGGDLADFECGVILKVEVHGSILHKVTTNQMLLETVEKFEAAKGEQKYTKFLSETCLKANPVASKDKAGELASECDNHQLASKLKAEALKPEESGQTQTNKNKGLEQMEIST